MRGPNPSYPIDLTADEANQFEQLIRAYSTPQALVMRTRIILTAYKHPEQSNQQIAAAIGTTDRTVRKWRGRWVTTHSASRRASQWGAEAFFPDPRARAGDGHCV
jgi:hypothetical protein